MSQGLAIDLDICLMQPVDELAVGHIVHAAGSIDTDDPEATELSLALFAMSKSKCHSAFDGLTSESIGGSSFSKVASGGKKVTLSSAVSCDVICSSWHFSLLLDYQHPTNSSFIGLADDCAGAEIPFQLLCFLGLDMGCFSMMAYYLTCSGKFKPLGSRSICFDLWHVYLL